MVKLRLRDTCAHTVRNVYLISLTKNLWYQQREQLHTGGGGALSQSAGQGMTKAFTDTLYRLAKTSSSVHRKAVFTDFIERDSR